jgi:hypothetical protein
MKPKMPDPDWDPQIDDHAVIYLRPRSRTTYEGLIYRTRMNEGGEKEYYVGYMYTRAGGYSFEAHSWVKREQLKKSTFPRTFYETGKESLPKNS